MDARKETLKTIVTAIRNENFKFTGITDTGEIIIAVLSDMDKKLLDKCFHREWGNKEKLKYIKNMAEIQGRSAKELMNIYLQQIASKEECCSNGLRIRNIKEENYETRFNEILAEEEE